MDDSSICSFDTAQEGELTASVFDFYGKRLATASTAGPVKVFQVPSEGPPVESAVIDAHSGGALALAWAYPRYGSLLASGGTDKRVVISKETSTAKWLLIYAYEAHSGPITTLDWAPWELGLVLLVGSADGCISLVSRVAEDRWEALKFVGHPAGVNAVSWSPAAPSSILAAEETYLRRKFVSGGPDGVKLWVYGESGYTAEFLERGPHVKDVEWNRENDMIAACTNDGKVLVWNAEGGQQQEVLSLKCPVWSVSWSLSGGLLAVTSEDNNTRFLRRNLEGAWELVTTIGENGVLS